MVFKSMYTLFHRNSEITILPSLISGMRDDVRMTMPLIVISWSMSVCVCVCVHVCREELK